MVQVIAVYSGRRQMFGIRKQIIVITFWVGNPAIGEGH